MPRVTLRAMTTSLRGKQIMYIDPFAKYSLVAPTHHMMDMIQDVT